MAPTFEYVGGKELIFHDILREIFSLLLRVQTHVYQCQLLHI